MVYRLTQPKDALVDEIAWQHCSHQPGRDACHVCQVAPSILYLEKARIILAEIWRKNIDAMNESERTRTMKGSLWKIVAIVSNDDKRRAEEDDTYTLRPGESSVYNFSMVFDDPPAPAAREELGLATCDVAARRLQKEKKRKKGRVRKETQYRYEGERLRGNVAFLSQRDTRTGFAHREAWRLQSLRSAKRWNGRVRQSRTRLEK
jgi:hypothetical protein